MIRIERPECPHPQALDNQNYKHPLNKDALRMASHDKCMYCESKISHIDFAHVEHIKPKAEDKFPRLAYEWDNLGYACPKCNNAKADKYSDQTPFIDPYQESPDDHIFACGSLLFQKNGSERGELTIREIELNRPELLEKRMEKIEDILKTINSCFRTTSEELKADALNELCHEADPNKEYSFIVKSVLEANDVTNKKDERVAS